MVRLLPHSPMPDESAILLRSKRERWVALCGIAVLLAALVVGAAVAILLGFNQLTDTSANSPSCGVRMVAGIAAAVAGGALLAALRVLCRSIRRLAGAADREARSDAVLEAFDLLPDGLVLFDSDDRLVVCNEAFRTIHPAFAGSLRPGARLQDLIRVSIAT